jgi:hypothetical protein
MKKILILLPLLICTLACSGISFFSPQDVGNMVNATLTAIAQTNSQGNDIQSTITEEQTQETPSINSNSSSGLHYYWPTILPEGFSLNALNSAASADGFALEFINPSIGTIAIWGGDRFQFSYCPTDSTPQTVRGFDGCFPPSTGGGFNVQWNEMGVPYSVGGLGLSRDLALQIAEQLESLNLITWQERLMQ